VAARERTGGSSLSVSHYLHRPRLHGAKREFSSDTRTTMRSREAAAVQKSLVRAPDKKARTTKAPLAAREEKAFSIY
jgi:hypothetical protein